MILAARPRPGFWNDLSCAICAADFDQKLIDLERAFYILRTTGASENLLRFPAGLFSHFKMLGYYVMTGDARPTPSKYTVFDELSARLEAHRIVYDELVTTGLSEFNSLLREQELAGLSLPPHD